MNTTWKEEYLKKDALPTPKSKFIWDCKLVSNSTKQTHLEKSERPSSTSEFIQLKMMINLYKSETSC